MEQGFACEGVEEFGGEEVDLSAVGGGGVAADEEAVADGGAAVGVALDAEAREEVNGGLGELGEGVGGVQVDGEDVRHGDRVVRCGWVVPGLVALRRASGSRQMQEGRQASTRHGDSTLWDRIADDNATYRY